MTPSLPRFALALSLALLISLPALADKPATATVKGSVTYKGQPLPGGTISFHFAKGKTVSTSLAPDGSYSAVKVPVGEAKVTIETESLRPKVNPKVKPKDKENKVRYVSIPLKYGKADTTPLTIEVKAGKQNADFELKD